MAIISRTLHLSCNNFSGYRLSDSCSLSHSAVPGRALTVVPCSSCFDNKIRSCVKNGRLKCVYNRKAFICKASSGGNRRNPDFSRQQPNKHSFRGSRNRQNEDRDGFDDSDFSEKLSSKNGPILSFSKSPKFQATTTPGPREKDIVELFRKVQAQLRERAAAKKEDKRIEEASKVEEKETETVNSLLKLLKKHSSEQGKKKVDGFNSHEFTSDQQEGNREYTDDRGTSFIQNSASLGRPLSSFRRKSPVPRLEPQPTYTTSEETFDSASNYSTVWTRKKDRVKNEPEPDLEPESEPELKPKSFYQDEDDVSEVALGEVLDDESLDDDDDGEDDDDDDDDETVQEVIEHEDLSALKLTELRTLAKSRGVKGFSKMKKAELVELLSGYSDKFC